MSDYRINVRPADISADAITAFPIGSLVINSLTAEVYMIIEKAGEKIAKLIAGEDKQTILQHLQHHYVIQEHNPLTFDKGTMWINTSLMYAEPEVATEGFLTIQTEYPIGSGKYKWIPILPRSSAQNVMIGDEKGTLVTLEDLISENRMMVKPAYTVDKAQAGEIYLKSDNTLWFKTGNDTQDQRLIARCNKNLVSRLQKSISIGENPPINYDPEHIWVKMGEDADIVNSILMSMNVPVDGVTGLKFTRDFEGNEKSASIMTQSEKVMTIDLNATNDYGHSVLNYSFTPNTKTYLELRFNDPEEKAYLVFLKANVSQPIANTYGTELNESSLLIDKDKMKFRNVDTPKPFRLDGKTIYIKVDKNNTTGTIELGYVNDDGSLNPVHTNITMNVSHIGIGSYSSSNTGAKSIITIDSFKNPSIPMGYKGINNVLPDEANFRTVAPMTNLQAVRTFGNMTLNNLHAGAGYLITTPRDVNNFSDAAVGELLLDFDENILYGKALDGKKFPIAGQHDKKFVKHLAESLRVVHTNVLSLKKDKDDASILYFSEDTHDLRTLEKSNKLIRTLVSTIDNSPDGDGKTYKATLPINDTKSNYHEWIDFDAAKTQRYTTTKVYLDKLHDLIAKLTASESVFSGYEEFGYELSYITDNLPTDIVYLQNIANYKMKSNSLYIESVKKVDPNLVNQSQIDKIFNVPEDGMVTVYRDRSNPPKLQIKLYTDTGNEYTAVVNDSYKITSWNYCINEKKGVVEIPNTLKVKNDAYTNKLEVLGNTKLGGELSIPKEFSIVNNKGNVFKGEEDLINNSYNLSIGDTTTTNLAISSNSKPYWNRVMSDGRIQKEFWLLQEDIDRAWNYKGNLNTNNVLTDINNLANDKAIGYYLLTDPISKKSSGYPEENNRVVLEVFKNGNTYIQRATTISNDSDPQLKIHTRVFSNGVWGDWERTVSKEELDLKYDKTGGKITGNTSITGDLSVGANTTLNNLSIKNEIKANPDSAIGDKYLITYTTSASGNRINLGDASLSALNIRGLNTPGWTNPNDNTFYPFSLQKDLQADIDNLANNYMDKTTTQSALDLKYDKSTAREELARKLNKDKDDTTTGANYTYTNSSITFNNGKFDIRNISEYILPFNRLDATNLATGENGISKYYSSNISKGTSLYRFLETTGTSTLFNLGLPSSGNNDNNGITTNALFKFLDNGDLEYGAVYSNDSNTFTGFKRLLNNSYIVDNVATKSDSKVLSAKMGAMLYELNIAKKQGNLADFYSGNTYDINKFTSLLPGNYYVSTDKEYALLKLDKAKLATSGTPNGVLLVTSDTTTNAKSPITNYMYFNTSDNTDHKKNWIAFKTVKGKNESNWVYVNDTSGYLDEETLRQRLAKLREELLEKIMSLNYSYSGNAKNISIPYRLVHTFNQKGSGNTSDVKYNTNISLDSLKCTNESAIVLIRFVGYSYESNTIIDSTLNVFIESKSGNISIQATKSDLYNLTASPLKVGYELDSNKCLTLTVGDAVGNTNLSYDIYMSFRNIGNPKFNPQITGYAYTDAPTVVKVPNQLLTDFNNPTTGIFNNH